MENDKNRSQADNYQSQMDRNNESENLSDANTNLQRTTDEDDYEDTEDNEDVIPNPDDFDEGDSDDTEDNERDATRTPGL
jgi:hypothetical protein